MEQVWDELTKHDGLIIVKFLGSTIYQSYFMKILLVLFLIIQLFGQTIQIYLFINELSVLEFIQYSIVFCMSFYPILGAIILLIDPKLVENLFQEVKILPIESASEPTKRKIKMEMKIVSIFTIINITVAMFIGFAILIFNRYDYTTVLPIKYFVDYHPEYSGIFANIYKGSFTFTCTFLITPHAYQIIYYTQHMKYQIWMLIDLIDDITTRENCDVLESSLIENFEYQQQIKLKLVEFVKRHQELLTAGRKKIKEISNYIVYFSVCGLLGFISVFYIIATDSLVFYDYRYMPALCLCGGVTAAALLMAGQTIETVTDNAYYLLQQIEWYNMNIENRRIYLLILTCAQKKIAIQFSENYSINHALGLALVRGAYSVMSVLAGFDNA